MTASPEFVRLRSPDGRAIDIPLDSILGIMPVSDERCGLSSSAYPDTVFEVALSADAFLAGLKQKFPRWRAFPKRSAAILDEADAAWIDQHSDDDES